MERVVKTEANIVVVDFVFVFTFGGNDLQECWFLSAR